MVKTVYADVLFLINFIINYLILFASAHIGAARIRRFRIAIGALIGAIYGVFALFPGIPFITGVFAKIAVSVLMVLASFGKDGIAKMTLLLLAVTLAFGGVIFAASLAGPGNFFEIQSGVYYIHMSVSSLLISSAVAYLILFLVFRRSGARATRQLCRVRISESGNELSLCALRDTGNSLRDPSTNAPVLISDYPTLRSLFPKSILDILDNTSPQNLPLCLDALSNLGVFKVVPYKTVGQNFALMLAFRPEKVLLDGEKLDGALVAISPCKVSDGGAYSAII